jgi:hypothetical protein
VTPARAKVPSEPKGRAKMQVLVLALCRREVPADAGARKTRRWVQLTAPHEVGPAVYAPAQSMSRATGDVTFGR